MNQVPLFDLAGKVALVTGGNGGLGLAMALALQGAGARVVVTGRNQTKNLAAQQHGLTALALDVRNEADVVAVIEQTVAQWGGLDILVNNAGIYRDQCTAELAQDDWDEIMDTNLKGMYLCAKHAIRVFAAQGRGGKIINIGSMYSLFGHPASIGYTTSKTAVLGLTRALAAELGPQQICVNAILPGWFKTDINGDLPQQQRGRDIKARTPLGKWGEGADMAGAVLFLASGAADFITGVALPVDGGYHISDRKIYLEVD